MLQVAQKHLQYGAGFMVVSDELCVQERREMHKAQVLMVAADSSLQLRTPEEGTDREKEEHFLPDRSSFFILLLIS